MRFKGDADLIRLQLDGMEKREIRLETDDNFLRVAGLKVAACV